MREAIIFSFKFRYVNSLNLPTHLLFNTGRVNREGLSLGEEKIMYQDIVATSVHKNRLVVSLMPYATLGPETTKAVLPRHTAVVLAVDRFAKHVKATIDQRSAQLLIEDRLGSMTKEEIKHIFKRINCPHCDSTIDLTYLPQGNFVYCHYCGSLFDKYGYPLPGGESYTNCPETGYFDQVGHYTDFKMYYLGKEKEFYRRRHYCGDAYAYRFSKRGLLKNTTFLFGAMLMLWERYRAGLNQHPVYEGLFKGNILAQDGKMAEAAEYYYKSESRNPGHPGIHLNYGLGYLNIGEQEKALAHFNKALEACPNYSPVIRIVEKYGSGAPG